MRQVVSPTLRLRDVRVQFDGVVAIDVPKLDIFGEASVAVLLGPNGAGKSSLINATTGYATVQRPGSIVLDDGCHQELTSLPRDQIVRIGVARTFQTPTVFPSLTLRDSLLLGAILSRPNSLFRRLLPLFHHSAFDGASVTLVEHLIEELGLGDEQFSHMDQLPFVTLRRAEFARTLAMQPRVLFLDEPSAGADESEVNFLIAFLASGLPRLVNLLHQKGLYRHSQVAIGVVTHDRALLDGLATSCSAKPMAHYFERGRLTLNCWLTDWLDSSKHP